MMSWFDRDKENVSEECKNLNCVQLKKLVILCKWVPLMLPDNVILLTYLDCPAKIWHLLIWGPQLQASLDSKPNFTIQDIVSSKISSMTFMYSVYC